MACEVAAAANVQHLILFHHDPSYTDDMIRKTEAHVRSIYPNVTAAYEGLEITIGGEQPIAVHSRTAVAETS
jgi:ribonuclease BN (tRNA processing enzyme)